MTYHPTLTGDALNDAIAEAARCRASGRHRLDPIPPPIGSPRPEFGSLLAERCELCGTVRYAIVSRLTGDRLTSYRYDHTPTYRAALDAGYEPTQWRAEYWSAIPPEMFLDAERGGHVAGQPVHENVTPIKGKRKAG